MTTGDAAVAPPVAEEPGPRSWRRAFDDLRGGWRQRPLWGYLGWQDIKQRYRRSVLGPLWISITMGVIATAMGILYGALFHEPIQTFLPYVATGLLIWNFINGCILEGSEVFIANEGLIRFLPAPLTLHVYRLVWRQTLFFAHNLVIWALLMIIFQQPVHWSSLLAIPAFAVLALNGAWIAVLAGIVATRFRDIPPIIGSLTQLLFFMTPIVWSYDRLRSNPLAAYVELNPVMHFVEILREPLLGQEIVAAPLDRGRRDHRCRLRCCAGLPAQLPRPRGLLGVAMVSIDIEGAAVDFPIFDAKTRSLKKAVLGRAGGRIGTNSKVPIIEALRDIIGLAAHTATGWRSSGTTGRASPRCCGSWRASTSRRGARRGCWGRSRRCSTWPSAWTRRSPASTTSSSAASSSA